MHPTISRLVDSIRRPEYTGENRCLPCTVLNTIVAIGVSAILAVVGTWVLGVATLVACLWAIYVRGYLVPGTPTLTKRYLPASAHRLFGTHHADGEFEDAYEAGDRSIDDGRGELADTDGEFINSDGRFDEADGEFAEAEDEFADADPETLLRATGVVSNCADEEDLCLDGAFREGWRERMASLETEQSRIERLAGRLDVDPERLELDGGENAFAVRYEGGRIATWPSEAAFLADLAAAPELDERAPVWREFGERQQGTVLTALRVFLEECPSCGGEITGNEETVESCCSTATRSAVGCADCESKMLSTIQ